MMLNHLLQGTLVLTLLTPASLAQVAFVDVTASSGIQYSQNAVSGVTATGMAVMSGGAAAGDVDGDGWVDVLVTRLHGSPILFRNMGEDSSGQHLGFSNSNLSSFGAPGRLTRTNGASFGDVDGDGDLDLLCTGLVTARHYLWINDGAGHFSEEGAARGLDLPGDPEHRGFSSSFGDYDRDGYLDLYVTEWGHYASGGSLAPSNSRLLRNKGAVSPGYFEDVTVAAGVALESGTANTPGGSWGGVFSFTPKFADFNNDGWPDLAIAGDFTTSRLFWNNGDGTFTDGTAAAGVGRDENGMGSAVGDFNGDGNQDWFVTSIYDTVNNCPTGGCNWGGSGNRMYYGDGQGTFTDATDLGVRDGGWGWGATNIDFDNDGLLDLAMTNGVRFGASGPDAMFHHDVSKLFHNTGSGFTDVGVSMGIDDRRSGKGIVKLDYDRDGDQDLLIVNAGAQPVLYRNDAGATSEWLQLELQGSGANSFGIGARVELFPDAGDAPLVRWQSASSNYLSQNEALLHFGLGVDQVVKRIEVHWPAGTTTVLRDVPCRQRLVVVEP
jgi:hypothetical protein